MISREEILSRFEHWLDGALAREAPPAGIDAEILAAITANPVDEMDGAGDYAMWSAITALTQEVKLQGRAFKDLNTTLDTQAGRALEEIRSEFAGRERLLQRQAEHRCRKEILHALLDIRDRLERGLDSAKAGAAQPPARSWLQRFFGSPPGPGAFRIRILISAPTPPDPISEEPRTTDSPGGGESAVSRVVGAASGAVQALIKGYELGLERLDQILADIDVRHIRALGEPFDPRRMNALDKQPSAIAAEGVVLEVYRSGFEWNGEVFRPAQVKVSTGADPRSVSASVPPEVISHE